MAPSALSDCQSHGRSVEGALESFCHSELRCSGAARHSDGEQSHSEERALYQHSDGHRTAVANGVLDVVRAGDIPKEKANDLGIIVSVWLDPAVLTGRNRLRNPGSGLTARPSQRPSAAAMRNEPSIDWLLKIRTRSLTASIRWLWMDIFSCPHPQPRKPAVRQRKMGGEGILSQICLSDSDCP